MLLDSNLCCRPIPVTTAITATASTAIQWLFLLPKKWNPKTHKSVYSWRYDPRELGAAQAPAADARRKNMRRAVADDA